MNQDDSGPPPPDEHEPPRPARRPYPRPSGGEPVFNLPPLVLVFAGLLVVIHLVSMALDSREAETWQMLLFAFIPARYGELAAALPVPAAAFWSPITYSFLHGSWTHLLVNLFWLAAFASPVTSRLGSLRSAAIAIFASLGGALAHFLAFPGEIVPMIGASAIVAGFMGAAARFAFVGSGGTRLNVHGPAQSLVQAFSSPRFLIFVLVWLGLNLLFGTGAVPIAGDQVAIAWQAHVGGFFAGLLAFSLFDRG